MNTNVPLPEPDLYAILGALPTADADAIRAAYLERIKQVHPDHATTDQDQARRTRAAARLNAAHEVLSDPVKRWEYGQRRAQDARGSARPSSHSAGGAPAGARPPATPRYAASGSARPFAAPGAARPSGIPGAAPRPAFAPGAAQPGTAPRNAPPGTAARRVPPGVAQRVAPRGAAPGVRVGSTVSARTPAGQAAARVPHTADRRAAKNDLPPAPSLVGAVWQDLRETHTGQWVALPLAAVAIWLFGNAIALRHPLWPDVWLWLTYLLLQPVLAGRWHETPIADLMSAAARGVRLAVRGSRVLVGLAVHASHGPT